MFYRGMPMGSYSLLPKFTIRNRKAAFPCIFFFECRWSVWVCTCLQLPALQPQPGSGARERVERPARQTPRPPPLPLPGLPVGERVPPSRHFIHCKNIIRVTTETNPTTWNSTLSRSFFLVIFIYFFHSVDCSFSIRLFSKIPAAFLTMLLYDSSVWHKNTKIFLKSPF